MAQTGDIEIAVNAAGVDEALDGIDETEQALEDAGDQMGETAGDMQDLNRRMKGIGQTLVATLAVASAGILSTVPVLSEAFAGLAAVARGFGFQIDRFLRPLLEPFAGLMFNIADAVFTAEGAWGTLAGVIGTIVGLFGAVILPATVLASKLGIVASTSGALIAAGKILGGVLLALGSALLSPLVIAGLLTASLILLIDHFIGWGNIVDWTIEKLGDLVDWLVGIPEHLSGVASGIANWASNVAGEISDLVTGIADRFTDLVNDAADWGRNLLLSFVDGILSRVNRVTSVIDDVAGRVRDRLPFSPAKEGPLSDLDQAGPAFIDTVAGGIEANVGQITQATENAAGAASDGSGGFNADRGSQPPTVRMDGRRLSQQDSRYRRDGTASRGRNG